ncbi:membrane protein [Planotetraspora thailandica]|uniref:Membrane protein n=1 Tax=Planotetraspora thailandica TaxID=487172 RepID=A0A8J3Y0T6_9ACTN|nr:membrane protein [Planotetraspora thailandica]
MQLALLGLLHALVGLSTAALAAGVAYMAALWALLAAAARRSGTRTLGPADHVTLARALLVGGVTALVAVLVMTDHPAKGLPLVILVTLSTVALILDAVDGRVARRTGTASRLGARFDMEVDAFLILVLSVFVAASLGVWVTAIGAMRYAFVAAGWVAPWLRGSLPPSFARKTVAAVQGIVLVVAASGVLPYAIAAAAVGLALASLVWSFGRDVVWLWRNRTPVL